MNIGDVIAIVLLTATLSFLLGFAVGEFRQNWIAEYWDKKWVESQNSDPNWIFTSEFGLDEEE